MVSSSDIRKMANEGQLRSLKQIVAQVGVFDKQNPEGGSRAAKALIAARDGDEGQLGIEEIIEFKKLLDTPGPALNQCLQAKEKLKVDEEEMQKPNYEKKPFACNLQE